MRHTGRRAEHTTGSYQGRHGQQHAEAELMSGEVDLA